MKRILCDVVVRGTATKARSATWNIFGKTGTAHISQGKGGYSETRFNSSFMGGAPAENPKLIIVMIIHEPDKSLGHYGGVVSAPPPVACWNGAWRIWTSRRARISRPAAGDCERAVELQCEDLYRSHSAGGVIQ